LVDSFQRTTGIWFREVWTPAGKPPFALALRDQATKSNCFSSQHFTKIIREAENPQVFSDSGNGIPFDLNGGPAFFRHAATTGAAVPKHFVIADDNSCSGGQLRNNVVLLLAAFAEWAQQTRRSGTDTFEISVLAQAATDVALGQVNLENIKAMSDVMITDTEFMTAPWLLPDIESGAVTGMMVMRIEDASQIRDEARGQGSITTTTAKVYEVLSKTKAYMNTLNNFGQLGSGAQLAGMTSQYYVNVKLNVIRGIPLETMRQKLTPRDARCMTGLIGGTGVDSISDYLGWKLVDGQSMSPYLTHGLLPKHRPGNVARWLPSICPPYKNQQAVGADFLKKCDCGTLENAFGPSYSNPGKNIFKSSTDNECRAERNGDLNDVDSPHFVTQAKLNAAHLKDDL